jgi:hypothetical protein
MRTEESPLLPGIESLSSSLWPVTIAAYRVVPRTRRITLRGGVVFRSSSSSVTAERITAKFYIKTSVEWRTCIPNSQCT